MKRHRNRALAQNRTRLRERGISQVMLYATAQEAAFIRQLGPVLGAHWSSLATRAADPDIAADAALLADVLRLARRRARAQFHGDQSRRSDAQMAFEGIGA